VAERSELLAQEVGEAVAGNHLSACSGPAGGFVAHRVLSCRYGLSRRRVEERRHRRTSVGQPERRGRWWTGSVARSMG
jgi:hypothetical protein